MDQLLIWAIGWGKWRARMIRFQDSYKSNSDINRGVSGKE